MVLIIQQEYINAAAFILNVEDREWIGYMRIGDLPRHISQLIDYHNNVLQIYVIFSSPCEKKVFSFEEIFSIDHSTFLFLYPFSFGNIVETSKWYLEKVIYTDRDRHRSDQSTEIKL